ncbi:MAG: HAD family hydrolase [Gammaproteobacteria bacterium]
MNSMPLYALDFDGVICDSAVETGITGWKAAARLWTDMDSEFPPQSLIDRFREVRPIIETGYESIIAVRMLHEGASVQTVLSDFSERKQDYMQQSDSTVASLKKLFGDIRDSWIGRNLEQWLEMNPLFPGIAEKLRRLNERSLWYIVTTKQERFVAQILAANGIEIPADRIFGLDRNMSKEAVLIGLAAGHAERDIYFVEDRLPTLLNVLNNEQLKQVKCQFAAWGYNTAEDKGEARKLPITTIGLDDFLSIQYLPNRY